MKNFIFGSFIFAILTGCTSQFDDCVENEREGYRNRNPKASHALMNKKQEEFEMMCSSLKGK